MTDEIKAIQDDNPELVAYRNQALDLLACQKTMVLAVSEDNLPWVAPVYFVFQSPELYFFSSPSSKHIQAVTSRPITAGAVYTEGNKLQDLRGLQMLGNVREVEEKSKAVHITARYLVKFPMAIPLLASGSDSQPDLNSRIRLYGFRPVEIHCTSNSLGFGRRVQIRL